MTTCDDRRLDLAAYVAGELEPDQHSDLERHLEGCAECRTELAEISDAAELAALLPFEFQPPRRLEERTFALIELEKERSAETNGRHAVERTSNVRSLDWAPSRRRSGVRTLLAPGIAAAFVALAVMSMALWTRTNDLESQLAEARSDSGEAAVVVDLASSGDTQVSASARLVPIGDDNYRIVLDAEDLPAPPKGYHYELWFGSGDGWASAGSFSSGGSDSTFEFQTAVDPVDFPIIDITLEPRDGQPERDGDEVMRGRIDISDLGA
ncbi:MAG: anti-sigma factor [Actinomycetota bacterium]|nr:anti-sigma factor [Actinomycetota bacterium]